MRHEHLDRLRNVLEEGESPLTPVVLAALAFAVVVRLVAFLLFVADAVVRFE